MQWREFAITEVFTVKNTHSVLRERTRSGGKYSYVTASAANNSVADYVDCDEACLEEGNCICIGGKTMVITYQPNDFISNDSHNLVLYVKDAAGRNEASQLFMVTCLQKALGGKYHWGDSISKRKIQADTVFLPCGDAGNVDFGYMAERIAELEAERIAELEAYLIAAGLDDYRLVGEDEMALERKGGVMPFRVGDVFDIETPKRKINANEAVFGKGHPYVVRTASRNGIRGLIDADERWLNDGNTIAFGQDTGTIFYQPEPYFTGDKIKIMRLKGRELNEDIALYLITAMKRGFSGFAWGQNSFNVEALRSVEVMLPVRPTGELDFDYMVSYVRAQKKLAIADAVRLKDRIIRETMRIVGR